MEKGRGLAL